MTREAVLDVIRSRASVRLFKSEPVPMDIIMRVLEAGVRAPTAGGGEQWFFVVVTSEEKRRRIHSLLRRAHELYATRVLREPLPEAKVRRWLQRIDEGQYYAPVYVAGYVDMRRRLCSEEYVGVERLWAHHSVAAALENMVLAAWGLGLGAVWLGVPLLMVEEFNRVLEPPEGLELVGVLALGYPAEDVKPRPRRPLSEVVKVL